MPFPVENIREVCKERKTSLAEIERDLKIGNGVIARWEFGKKYPPLDKIKAIADYLEVPVSRLTGEKEKNPAPTDGDGMSEARRELLKELEGMSEDEIYHLLDVIRAVKGRK